MNDSIAKEIFKLSDEETASANKYIIKTNVPADISKKIDEWQGAGVFKGEVEYDHSGGFSSILWTFGPIALLIGFWIFMMRRMSGRDGGSGGVFSVGKSKAKIFL